MKFNVYNNQLRQTIPFRQIDEIKLKDGIITHIRVRKSWMEIGKTCIIKEFTGYQGFTEAGDKVDIYEGDIVYYNISRKIVESGCITKESGCWMVNNVPFENLNVQYVSTLEKLNSYNNLNAVDFIDRLTNIDMHGHKLDAIIDGGDVSISIDGEIMLKVNKLTSSYEYHSDVIQKYSPEFLNPILGEAFYYLFTLKEKK